VLGAFLHTFLPGPKGFTGFGPGKWINPDDHFISIQYETDKRRTSTKTWHCRVPSVNPAQPAGDAAGGVVG
jgi:hypothetical protein